MRMIRWRGVAGADAHPGGSISRGVPRARNACHACRSHAPAEPPAALQIACIKGGGSSMHRQARWVVVWAPWPPAAGPSPPPPLPAQARSWRRLAPRCPLHVDFPASLGEQQEGAGLLPPPRTWARTSSTASSCVQELELAMRVKRGSALRGRRQVRARNGARALDACLQGISLRCLIELLMDHTSK